MVEVPMTFRGLTGQTIYDLPLAASLGDTDVVEILRTSDGAPASMRAPISTLKLASQYSYGCLLSNAATQTASTSSALLVEFDTEAYDNGGFHTTASMNGSRITIPAAFNGYLGQLYWGVAAAAANGALAVSVLEGGAAFVGDAGQQVIVNGTLLMSGASPPVVLATSNYFQLNAVAATEDRVLAVAGTYFGLRILGPLAA